MQKEIPKISFNENQRLDIEVMSFKQLSKNLNHSKNHNPFEVHKIEFFLIMVLTKKSYTHFVDFKSYALTKGSALFISKNQVHAFTKELKTAEGYCIIFNSLFTDNQHFLSGKLKLNRLFNYHIETPIITQKEMGKDDFIDLAIKLHEEYSSSNNFLKSEMLSSLLQVLFLKAERSKEIQSLSRVKISWLETFHDFKSLLEKEYINTRSSKAYASKLFVSYKFLNDVVKQLTGRTAKTFIDDFVIIEIKRYLISTSLSISEISYATGFEEPANMVKFFRKNTQTTPLKFRQSS